MKKGKEFDNIVNECLERLLVEGETLEQCLARYPHQAATLKPLLETALIVKQASVVQPRPEFRAKARYQFQAALQAVAAKRGFFPLAWPRWATIVAVVLVLLLAGGGTVAAASNSMPDEFLYPVKLATEQVQLTFTPSSMDRAELYTKLADRRVAEIASMVSKDKPEHLEKVTERLDTLLVMIATLAEAQVGKEQAEITRLPAPALPLPSETGEDNREYPRNDRLARLRMTVAGYAINHPAALRAMLNTAPESAKPALRRAIAIAEIRYQRVLEAVAE
jgi:hypothetical protein